MRLEFKSHKLPGPLDLWAPVALIAAAQGSIYACALIALFLGKACCCSGNLDESKMRDALGQGLRVYSALAASPKELLDPAVAALRVQGVQHIGDMLFGAGGGLAASPGRKADALVTETPAEAVQKGIAALGGKLGFFTITHRDHTVALLPVLARDGSLAALYLVNFIGHYLHDFGSVRPDKVCPTFAICIEGRLGAEGQHVSRSHLQGKHNKRLDCLLDTLINSLSTFFQGRLNEKASGRRMNWKLFQSVGQREMAAVQLHAAGCVTIVDAAAGTASVKSSSCPRTVYDVSLRLPAYCSCPDSTGLLCKHIRAVAL